MGALHTMFGSFTLVSETAKDACTVVRIIAACRRPLTNEGDLQHMCLITECTIGKKVQTVEVSWNTTTSRGIVPELTNQKGGWYTHTVDDNCSASWPYRCTTDCVCQWAHGGTSRIRRAE